MRPTLAITALLALSACASSYGASTSGSGDNHPAVCQEQSDLARNGLVDGRQQSIACPDHGIGPRLGQGGTVAVQGVPVAATAPGYNEYNENGALYRAGFDALVSTLPQN